MNDETTNESGAPASQAAGRRFDIEKVYLKDVSFETTNTPQVFLEEWQPETAVQIRTAVNRVTDDHYEVVLSMTVTAKQGESTAYLVEVHQAGIFAISGYSDEELGPVLGAYCPGTLYPFARQAIADLVWKGGFKQLLLGPINFDLLYEQKQQKAAARQQAGSG
jgi:preprotein translocase subunit SecB